MNQGDRSAALISIKVLFLDSDGKLVATVFGSTMFGILPPGMRSPFEVVLHDTAASLRVSDFRASVAAFEQVEEILFPSLEIVSSEKSIIDGSLVVTGTIRNSGDAQARTVRVAGTFFDPDGKVVAIASDITDPVDIEPGQTGAFRLVVDPSRSSLVNTFQLDAQSREFSLIPEFTAPSAMLIAVSIALSLFLVSKSRNLPRRLRWENA